MSILENNSLDIGVLNELTPATRWQRFSNYFMDMILLTPFMSLLAVIVEQFGIILYLDSLEGIFLYRLFAIFYYFPQEAIFSRTLGKLIMGTKALNEEGNNISVKQAFGRSLCRVIPFEELSFLFGGSRPRGWHDLIPKTVVISVRN